MMDKVRLKNLQFHAFHGCSQVEKKFGQKFEVDVEIAGDVSRAALTDDINDAYNFDITYQVVAETVVGTRFNLLEALAEEICRRLLELYPGTLVRVVVRKPSPPLPWLTDGLEVEIARGGITE
jgi:dihydroneopterin aldolase